MDAEVKVKWLAALRSGNYEQARGKLKIDKAYCCLGVLAHVQKSRVGTLPQADVLPDRLSAGLTKEAQRELAHRNDAGSSFAEIADYIEKTL